MPSNRCDFINEYLQTMTPNTPKICIDNAPFIGEPWRLWFHYSIANCGHFKITYSYAIETEWQHWFYRNQNDCRLASNNIRLFISDTVSDLDRLTTKFEFHEVSKSDDLWYSQAKEAMFNKYNTPKLWVNNLLKLANKHFDIQFSYDSFLDSKQFVLPDIGVYRFVAEEAKRRMNIYNEVVSYEVI
jgi:hypothetical protein